MTKTTRARYTLEFKQEAVRLAEGGQSIAAAAQTLGVVEQTLFNWVKAHKQGKLKGADSKRCKRRTDGDQPAAGRTGAREDGARHPGKSDGVLRERPELKYAFIQRHRRALKVERLHGQRFVTRRHARDEAIAWLLWYNSDRLHSTLAYVSPMQSEENWLLAQAKQVSS